MVKRKAVEKENENDPPQKRGRIDKVDRLSSLSDELLLRTLSFLPVNILATCHRLSHRFHTLSADSQLWKSAYYNRFVRPRASRIPGIRNPGVSSASLFYSSRVSRWLEDENLVKRGQETNWKKQYKLRHNWSKGSCDVSEIEVAERPSSPPMLVRLYEDIVVTADQRHGLRAWTMKGSQRLLVELGPAVGQKDDHPWGTPTSIAIDMTTNDIEHLSISIGFADGRFGVYILDKQKEVLTCQYMHSASSNGRVSAIAYVSPYLVTMTEAQLLSLYRFSKETADLNAMKDLPRLLSSLKSHTAWPPLTLAIRPSLSNIIISIAYALPTYLSGWSVGLQELRLTTKGTILHSRLTSAASQGFTPLFASASGSTTPGSETENTLSRTPTYQSIPSITKPTSLSYSHPYLLASHPDNTLTLYLVQSTETELTIEDGTRLWGHTSSISGAHVGDRGKAVSVSAHGNEIRLWELEGGLKSTSSRRRAAAGEASVQVRPDAKAASRSPHKILISPGAPRTIGTFRNSTIDELSTMKGWVGFDEEKVVVLLEKGHGSQALVVYDFS